MSLLEQMLWVDRLTRRPKDLPQVAELSGEDRAVLETIDPARLKAVHRTHALLVAGRWWQARFPALLATLEHAYGGRTVFASQLMSSPAFEAAVEEDVTAAALVGGVFDLTNDQDWHGPAWIFDLLAYEYLLSTGLPRRTRGESISVEVEARLLPDARWFEGGRLKRRALVCPFAWPVGELQEEPHDAEPDPHSLVFVLADAGAIELAGDIFADAVELLAGGASDAVLAEAIGEDTPELLRHLSDVGLI